MSDTALTVSQVLCVTVRLEDLDFNRLGAEIDEQVNRVKEALLGQAVRVLERQARQREPRRWRHRGQQIRRIQMRWGSVSIRRTRVLDTQTGQSYYLGDRLLGL